MTIWYMVYRNQPIEEIKVLKETEYYITYEYTDCWGGITTRKEAKKSKYQNYFKTYEEAYEFGLVYYENEIRKRKDWVKTLEKEKQEFIDKNRKP